MCNFGVSVRVSLNKLLRKSQFAGDLRSHGAHVMSLKWKLTGVIP